VCTKGRASTEEAEIVSPAKSDVLRAKKREQFEPNMQSFLLDLLTAFAIGRSQLEVKSIIARDQEEILDA
jgi:hypothetical protein